MVTQPDAINLTALPAVTRHKVRQARKRWKICHKCGGTFSCVDLLEANEYGGDKDHIGRTKGGTLYRCGPVIDAPVYVRLNRRGYSVSTTGGDGWALVLG